MTTATERTARLLSTATTDAPVRLVAGTVLAAGATVVVDTVGGPLEAVALGAVAVGSDVWVAQQGTTVVILGTAQSVGAAVGAKIRRTIDQTFTAGAQATLVFNSAVTDPHGFLSGGNLVVPPGLGGRVYLLSAHWRWDGTGASNNPILAIFVNGVPVVRDAPGATPPAFFEQHVSVPWPLEDGDIVRVDGVNQVTRAVSAVTAGGTDPTGPILEAWAL